MTLAPAGDVDLDSTIHAPRIGTPVRGFFICSGPLSRCVASILAAHLDGRLAKMTRLAALAMSDTAIPTDTLLYDRTCDACASSYADANRLSLHRYDGRPSPDDDQDSPQSAAPAGRVRQRPRARERPAVAGGAHRRSAPCWSGICSPCSWRRCRFRQRRRLVTNIAQQPPMQWYLDALYLNHGYSVLRTGSGPGRLIRYEVLDAKRRSDRSSRASFPTRRTSGRGCGTTAISCSPTRPDRFPRTRAIRTHWQRKYLEAYARHVASRVRRRTSGAVRWIEHRPLGTGVPRSTGRQARPIRPRIGRLMPDMIRPPQRLGTRRSQISRSIWQGRPPECRRPAERRSAPGREARDDRSRAQLHRRSLGSVGRVLVHAHQPVDALGDPRAGRRDAALHASRVVVRPGRVLRPERLAARSS